MSYTFFVNHKFLILWAKIYCLGNFFNFSKNINAPNCVGWKKILRISLNEKKGYWNEKKVIFKLILNFSFLFTFVCLPWIFFTEPALHNFKAFNNESKKFLHTRKCNSITMKIVFCLRAVSVCFFISFGNYKHTRKRKCRPW